MRLLDVNCLNALLDVGHVHHDKVRKWQAAFPFDPLATCTITENGFIRIVSAPSYGVRRLDVEAATSFLQDWKMSAEIPHLFLSDSLSLRDSSTFDIEQIRGHKQVTDLYLLGLAHRHGGRLVSFDTRLPWRAVRGAAAGLVENPADTLKA